MVHVGTRWSSDYQTSAFYGTVRSLTGRNEFSTFLPEYICLQVNEDTVAVAVGEAETQANGKAPLCCGGVR